jgi:hypothetical protein
MHYKSEVKGEGGIVARVVASSYAPASDSQIITWELEYPRIIHSELMTHRVFSRNGASSRAIPIQKVIEQVKTNPAKPVHWGKNQPGMQAKEELSPIAKRQVEALWETAATDMAFLANAMDECGAHKQIANRVLEPFQFMKVVLTTTEDENFFWLRLHEDADPTIEALARCMYWSADEVESQHLGVGDWHTPYFDSGFWSSFTHKESKEEALAISASCCAQVSFRALDPSLEKAEKIYQRLVESEPVHASPFEHQATPMGVITQGTLPHGCQDGVTHVDRNGNYWSGNFRGWIQNRQLIPNNVKN